MPPRLNLYGASRSLALRAGPSIAPLRPRILQVTARRSFADEKDVSKPADSPANSVLRTASEQARDIGKVIRETWPDLAQDAPVREILQRDEEGREKAPEVIKQGMDATNVVTQNQEAESVSFENLLALGRLERIAAGSVTGHKFELPKLPIPSKMNIHHRYDPVVDQVTNLIMLHGKLSVAQRNMAHILNHLRTAPPPTPNPARPLIPGSPPASHLPLNPVLYLTIAIDSVAPLLRIRNQRGAAGGGAALPIPVPLRVRQRRRQAVQWILDVVDKKKSRGSGKRQFAQKFAEEIVNVVEGKSPVWERRGMVHKQGTAARVNMNYLNRRR